MTVYLVGAGLGDPGLLRLRGRKLLGRADAILYDGLVDRRILAFAAPTARLIDVAKARSGEAHVGGTTPFILVTVAAIVPGAAALFGLSGPRRRGGFGNVNIARSMTQYNTLPNFTSNTERARQIYRPELNAKAYICTEPAKQTIDGLKRQVEDSLVGQY